MGGGGHVLGGGSRSQISGGKGGKLMSVPDTSTALFFPLLLTAHAQGSTML